LKEIRKYTRIRIKKPREKAPSSANRREKTTLGQIKQSRSRPASSNRPFVLRRRNKKREIRNCKKSREYRGPVRVNDGQQLEFTQDIHINIGTDRKGAKPGKGGGEKKECIYIHTEKSIMASQYQSN